MTFIIKLNDLLAFYLTTLFAHFNTMNPKKLAAISAVSIITFVFLLIATFFGLLGSGLFAILGDAGVAKAFIYGTISSGILSAIALIIAVVANTILVTFRI